MSINLRFLGAARNVTGSCYLLETNSNRVLIDCGLYQEREFKSRNWDPFPVDPGTIDAVFLTHAHLDHCGLLPKLVKEGFKGRIICTPPTEEIARIVLSDSGRIQQEDARFKKRRHRREGRKGTYPEVPLYTKRYAEEVFPMLESIDYQKPVKIGSTISATFYDAGHILGSSMIKLKVQCGSLKRSILFSGDIGSWDKPIIRDPTLPEQADYVLVESTYGNSLHKDPSSIKSRLSDVVNSAVTKGGNVVIPSFAIERTQELLYYLSELLREDQIPHLLAFVDSPMAINITEVFRHHPRYFDAQMLDIIRRGDPPFYFSTLKLTKGVGESKAINHIKASCIIIAGSGMCTGGRIKYHLVNNISRAGSTILFIGYQAKGTLGHRIVTGAKEVRVLGKIYPVQAHVEQISAFSAHADRSELLRWLSAFRSPPRHLFVVHGEDEVAVSFSKTIADRYGWRASAPQYLDNFALD